MVVVSHGNRFESWQGNAEWTIWINYVTLLLTLHSVLYREVDKKEGANNMGMTGFDMGKDLLLTGTGMILYLYKMCITIQTAR